VTLYNQGFNTWLTPGAAMPRSYSKNKKAGDLLSLFFAHHGQPAGKAKY